MKSCPVCKKVNLPDDLPSCPQCNSDLHCFDVLEQLTQVPDNGGTQGVSQIVSQAAPRVLKKSERSQNRFFYLSMIIGNFAVFGLAVICFWMWNLHHDLELKISIFSERLIQFEEKRLIQMQTIDKRCEKIETAGTEIDQKLKAAIGRIDQMNELFLEGSKTHARPSQKNHLKGALRE